MVNNVFCFAPTGKIIAACINYPGSCHDTQVAEKFIDIVVDTVGPYKICVDQGFPRSGRLFDKFVGPMSVKTRNNIAPVLRRLVMQRHNVYVSLRQSSEWGMRALQGSFTGLRSRLTSESDKIFETIYAIVLLHNFRTQYVGLNQITTVFSAEYEQVINIDGYDRISRYYETNVYDD